MKTKRWDVLANIIEEHKLKIGLEIGVKCGRNISQVLKQVPGFTFYGIDPWEPTPSYGHWTPLNHIDHEHQAQASIGMKKNVHLIKGYSAEVAKKWDITHKGVMFDLIFIDGDHTYEGVKQDIESWWPYLNRHGIMAGHDYGNTNKYGVTFDGVDQAVQEFFDEHFWLGPDHVWYSAPKRY